MFSKFIHHLVIFFTNKYLLALTLFLGWLIFFDENSFLHQLKLQSELNTLTSKREYYIQKLSDIKTDKNQILSNKETVEKFARENYFMKRKDEDLYLIKDAKELE